MLYTIKNMKHTDTLTVKYEKKVILLYSGLFFGFLGILSKIAYRPLIINSQINDLGIHGFVPNLFAALSLCLFAAYLTKKGHIKTMIFASCGILTYEIEQNWTSRTFDYLDIVATIIGLGISIFIFKIFVKRQTIVCETK